MKELQNIQALLNAPKDLYNKFGGYYYRSCESILASLKPWLAAQNCSLVLSDEPVVIGERVYIKATATLVNDKGEKVSTSAYAREEESKKGMDAAQITGATSSYARKYALNGLFAIDDTKDVDSVEYQQEKPKVTKGKAKESDELTKAKAEATKAKTKKELLEVWNKYSTLSKDTEFLSFMSNRKKEVV